MSTVTTRPTNWKDALIAEMPPTWAREIDVFEGQMALAKQGKLDPKVFSETRLRRGAYGQRYDNGQRHDGIETRTLDFGSEGAIKGVDTVWDAPGMFRIKIPFGGVTPVQMEVLAQLCLLYTSPSPRDLSTSRMPSSA